MEIIDVIALSVSGYAALVATIVFIWNVYITAKDTGQIKIGGFFGYLISGTDKTEVLYYEFVNSGKRSVMMTGLGGNLKRSAYKDGKSSFVVNISGLPIKLEPGDRYQVTFTEFQSINDNVKCILAFDSLGNKYKMSKKLLRELKKQKREMTKSP